MTFRFRTLTLALLGIVLLVASLRQLSAIAHGMTAIEAQHAARPADALIAAEAALHAAPWDATAHERLLALLSTKRPAVSVEAAAGRRLAWSPAASAAWQDWQQTLMRQGRFSSIELTRASRLVQLRAPRDPAVRMQQALLVPYYWTLVPEDTRTVWMQSVNEVLADERFEYLAMILRARRAPYFCVTAGRQLPMDQWCRFAVQATRLCTVDGGPDDPRRQRQCRRFGFPRP